MLYGIGCLAHAYAPLAEQLEFGHKPINITSAIVKGRWDNKWIILNVYRAKPLGR